MSSHTKIVVLRSKELVYALVLIVISVLIIMTAVSLFVPQNQSKKESKTQREESETGISPQTDIAPQSVTEYQDTNTAVRYVPGIYTSAIRLGSTNAELQITVDADHINSITLANLDESVSTLYPLMQPTLDDLSAVILEKQTLDGINYTDENRYTAMLLMQAIRDTLDKAVISENADSPDLSTIY